MDIYDHWEFLNGAFRVDTLFTKRNYRNTKFGKYFTADILSLA